MRRTAGSLRPLGRRNRLINRTKADNTTLATNRAVVMLTMTLQFRYRLHFTPQTPVEFPNPVAPPPRLPAHKAGPHPIPVLAAARPRFVPATHALQAPPNPAL